MTAPPVLVRSSAAPAKLGVVVHSFWNRWQAHHSGVHPPPLEVARAAAEVGFGGIQTLVSGWEKGQVEALRAFLAASGMGFEGSIEVPRSNDDAARFRKELERGVMAGATVFRCYLGWRRYEVFRSRADVQSYLVESRAALALALPELRAMRCCLAVENHKDLRAVELAALVDDVDSEWVGCCYDLGNNIALMESAEETLEILGARVKTVHLKDVAVARHREGLVMAEVPLGQGMLDLRGLIGRCREVCPQAGYFLEMITRAPLVVPCGSARYEELMQCDDYDHRVASMNRRVLERKFKLPSVMGMSIGELCALEARQNRDCLRFAVEELGFAP